MGCWEKYGSPKIVNKRTIAAAKAADRVYEFHGAGGGLHCLLDDWNLEDPFCERYTGADAEKSQEEMPRRFARRCFPASRLRNAPQPSRFAQGTCGSEG